MAREALAAIRQLAPGVLVRFERLDLANLESVNDFAVRMSARDYPIDLLVNNAGIPETAERRVTADGFEMQLGVNYLGHYALTARLLPLLRRSRRPRVVHVSSLVHRQGSIQFEDLHMARGYSSRAAHSQSKLATLMFALELQARSDRHGWRLFSTAAHPGYVRPGFVRTGFVHGGAARGESARGLRSMGRKERKHPLTIGQTVSDGALPTLFAATAAHARPGGFYGPSGRFELAGAPGPARIDDKVRDPEIAQRLWEISESLTGVRWPAE